MISGEAKSVDANLTNDWVRNTWPELRGSFEAKKKSLIGMKLKYITN